MKAKQIALFALGVMTVSACENQLNSVSEFIPETTERHLKYLPKDIPVPRTVVIAIAEDKSISDTTAAPLITSDIQLVTSLPFVREVSYLYFGTQPSSLSVCSFSDKPKFPEFPESGNDFIDSENEQERIDAFEVYNKEFSAWETKTRNIINHFYQGIVPKLAQPKNQTKTNINAALSMTTLHLCGHELFPENTAKFLIVITDGIVDSKEKHVPPDCSDITYIIVHPRWLTKKPQGLSTAIQFLDFQDAITHIINSNVNQL